MNASKPELVVVETPAAVQEDATPPRPSRSDRWIRLGLLVAVVVAALVAVWQTQRVDVLSGQVEGLEIELGQAQEALGLYEHRFGEIRASVGDLRAQLGDLERLVETSPELPHAP